MLSNSSRAERPFFTFGGSVSQGSRCPPPMPAWHHPPQPAQTRSTADGTGELIQRTADTGEELCFLSCQACKASVARGCAGQTAFAFGLKGELLIQSRDLRQSIPTAPATNPAANGTAAAHCLLLPLAVLTIWAPGLERTKENLPGYNLAFYFFRPCTTQ